MDRPYTEQEPEPTDKKGNSWGYLKQHGILRTYTPIGIDNRGFGVFADEGSRWETFLDDDGSFEYGHLREGGWFRADDPAGHVVKTAEEFGPWQYVEPAVVREIEERGIGDVDPGEPELKPSTEAHDRWQERGDPDVDVMDAWETAEPIEWPREDDDATARHHMETGCTFLREGNRLITVYPNPAEMDEAWLAREIHRQAALASSQGDEEAAEQAEGQTLSV